MAHMLNLDGDIVQEHIEYECAYCHSIYVDTAHGCFCSLSCKYAYQEREQVNKDLHEDE